MKIRGKSAYLYRPRLIEQAKLSISSSASGVMSLQPKPFFAKAIKSQGLAPKTVTLDGYAASHRAVREMKTDELLPKETTVRSSKYLNNLIEQEHRNIKSRVNAMLGFNASGTQQLRSPAPN